MRVVSLYDGIGGAAQALKELGVSCHYFHSEIDTRLEGHVQSKFSNYHKMVPIGDVENNRALDLQEIDLLIGGSPCTSFSVAGKRAEFDDPRGKLLFKYVDILKHIKPKWFLLENVASMRKQCKEAVDELMGVEGIKINSAWYSSQRRWRYYWTNIPYKFPEEEDWSTKVIKDILESDRVGTDYWMTDPVKCSAYDVLEDGQNWKDLPDCHPEKIKIMEAGQRYLDKGHTSYGGWTGFYKVYDKEAKAPTLTASGLKQHMTRFIIRDSYGDLRYPTELECERLQCFPDNYTLGLKKRYHALGNFFNVATIKAILIEIS
jgi:DNA (cytosine-5)-methyltransferase 3A